VFEVSRFRSTELSKRFGNFPIYTFVISGNFANHFSVLSTATKKDSGVCGKYKIEYVIKFTIIV
jgi:hypothetical protein